MEKKNKGGIAIYQNPGKGVELKVRLEKETVWLDVHQMALIFDVNRSATVKHIRNIYRTGELDRDSTCSILEQVAADGKVRKMNFYNLDVIISVGYRANSKQATQFRIWATKFTIARNHTEFQTIVSIDILEILWYKELNFGNNGTSTTL